MIQQYWILWSLKVMKNNINSIFKSSSKFLFDKILSMGTSWSWLLLVRTLDVAHYCHPQGLNDQQGSVFVHKEEETVLHCVCNYVYQILNFFFFAKIECGLYLLDRFDVLMSKII
jgi:hypothetical protein